MISLPIIDRPALCSFVQINHFFPTVHGNKNRNFTHFYMFPHLPKTKNLLLWMPELFLSAHFLQFWLKTSHFCACFQIPTQACTIRKGYINFHLYLTYNDLTEINKDVKTTRTNRETRAANSTKSSLMFKVLETFVRFVLCWLWMAESIRLV